MNIGRLQDIWRNLEPRGQIGLVGAAIAVVATMFLLFTFSSRPSFTTLASNLSPADTGAATKALAGAGIGYKLGDGGTSIQVKDADAAQARISLAEKNLLGSTQPGYELFDHQSIGITDFQQKVQLQRAKEGEISNTIEEIDGVSSATVHFVIPDESVFADEKAQASASVLLQGNQLDPATVSGIAHLVAASADHLSPQDVTINDASGAQIWPTSASGGTTASTKLQAEQTYESQLGAQINALLASTLGAGKAQARVHAELNADQTTIDKVTYGKKGTPLQTQSADETLKNKGGSTAGKPSGAASNIPSYAAGSGATGNGSSNYSNKSGSTVYGVDKTVEHTSVVPGKVQRLSVALLVDKSIPAAQVASLKASVASMAGIDTARGDTLAVSTVNFAKPAVTAAPAAKTGPLANPIGLAKYVVLGVGALVFLFLMRRGLKRREGEDLGVRPTWLHEIEATVPLSELEAGPSRALGAGAVQQSQRQAELEEIVQTQPQRVAAQVGQWMQS